MTEEVSRRKFLIRSGQAATSVAAADVTYKEFAPDTPSQLDHDHPPPKGTAEDLRLDFLLLEQGIKCQPGSPPVEVTYQGSKHKFACLSNWHDAATDARAFVFCEIDASGKESDTLRVLFPGRAEYVKGAARVFGTSKAENNAVEDILHGRLSSQSAAVDHYFDTFDKELAPYFERHPDATVHLFAHSLGSGSALHMKYLLQERRGISAKLLQWEPFAPAHQVIRRMDILSLPENHARDTLRKWKKDITDVDAYPPTNIRRMPLSESPVSNWHFAENVYLIDFSPDKPYLKEKEVGAAAAAGVVGIAGLRGSSYMSRRDLGKAAAFATAAAAAGTKTGDTLGVSFDLRYHLMAEAGKVLERDGDHALKRVRDCKTVASDDDILHPRAYSMTRFLDPDYDATQFVVKPITGHLR